jgi:hypothetical protein
MSISDYTLLTLAERKLMGSQISTGREDFAGGSSVLTMLSERLEIEFSDFETENAMLGRDYLWLVVEIVI